MGDQHKKRSKYEFYIFTQMAKFISDCKDLLHGGLQVEIMCPYLGGLYGTF